MPPRNSQRLNFAATIIVACAVYALTARLSLLLAYPGSNATALWPPSGLALALLLIRGRGFWPAIFLGAFAANLWQLTGDLGAPAPTAALLSAVTAAGNTLEALCGLAILKKLITNPLSAFDSTRHALMFTLAAAAAGLVGALAGPTALCASGTAPWREFPAIFATWWTGDAVGMFTFTPLVILWYSRVRGGMRRGWTAEFVVAMIAVLGATAALFSDLLHHAVPASLEYLILPVLLLVSYRLGQRAAVTALALMSLAATLFAVNGSGPFAGGTGGLSVLLLQGFTGTLALTMIFLSSRSREMEISTGNLKSATEYLMSVTEYAENLVATANSLIVLLNPEGKITIFNQAAEQATGIAAEEVMGKHWSDAFPEPGGKTDLPGEFIRIMSEGTPGNFECGVTHRDGGVRYIRWQDNLVRQNDGVAGVLFFGQDITENRKMERALAESEAKLQALLSSLTAGIFVLDGAGRFISCNTRWADMLGYTVGEILLMRNTDVVHPDAHPDAGRRLNQLVSGEVAEYQDVRKFIRKDRSVMWGLLSVTRLSGSDDQFMMTVMDITEHKRAEEELGMSRTLLQAMLDASLDAVTVTDAEGVFRASNRVLQERWGRTAEEIVGHSAGEILPPDIFSSRVERVRRTLATGDIDHFTDEYGGRFFENTMAPIVEKDGARNSVVMYSRDITERELAKRELQRSYGELEARVRERTRELTLANERLKELDRLKSNFLATMSHELRTPMNSIIGFTGILQQELTGPLNDEQKKQVGIVFNSARHLLTLINDLLDLSRIDAGRITIEAKPFDFAGVIREVADILAPMIDPQRIVLTTDAAATRLEMTGDRKRCLQVLLNLANNALKFTPRGEVRIFARIGNGRLVAGVSDTGIGIREEQKGMLFEAFRQLDDTARRAYEGTGLGLHLCRKLLDLMGGEIHFESEYGRGSTFTFSLPVQPGSGTGGAA